MARKSTRHAPPEDSGETSASPTAIAVRTKPLIFISHDSRDSDLAEAFGELLTDVSSGTLKYFQSSDNKGTAGIEYGDEWYTTILRKLREATDVVALLTAQSIDRPWILYEAGIAVGKLETRVIGLSLGVNFTSATSGPFGLFQKPSDDEDSLTKLMMQLLQRNPDAEPREATVRMQVRSFREKVATLLQQKGSQSIIDSPEESTAKLFDEVKEMVRELPDRVRDSVEILVQGESRRKYRRFHPRMVDELMFRLHEHKGRPETGWLIFVSLLREDFPWLYEPGMELYQALRGGKSREIAKARTHFLSLVNMTAHSSMFREFIRPDNEDAFFMLRHIDEILHLALSRVSSVKSMDVGTNHEPPPK